jgi:pimeloyl-ACP methyl ester carboxylesterase
MTAGLVSTDAPRLVELAAADGHPLQGLLYVPEHVDAAEAAVLNVHGKGGNCYSGPTRTLPPLIAPQRAIHLALNLRCHDLAYSLLGDAPGIARGDRVADGGMWERLDDGATDIDAGVAWLRERTGLPVFVIGHSMGGYYLGDYSAQCPQLAGRIFLSPLTSVRFPLPEWFPDPAERDAVRERAEQLVASGRGHMLIPLPAWYCAISADSLIERLHERPDRWLSGCNASDVPLLLAWGGAETRAEQWRALYEQLSVGERQALEIPGTGHSYLGHEHVLADAITAFISTTGAKS